MNLNAYTIVCAAATLGAVIFAAPSARAPSQSHYNKEPDTFYPPDNEVEAALQRFLTQRKLGSFEGALNADKIAAQRQALAKAPSYSAGFSASYMRRFWATANYWVQQSDDFIRGMIPGENPRMLVPSYAKGCPLHLGGIQSLRPIWGKPNRFRCTVGGEEWGPGVRVVNPATGKPVTVTDDGYGWKCPKGFPNPDTYYFVAAYRLSLLKMLFSRPYRDFVDFHGYTYARPAVWCTAYIYALTQDPSYAHKVLVMLARLADVYRNCNSLYSLRHYKARAYVTDHNFECNVIRQCLDAYDFTFDAIPRDKALLEWFAKSRPAPDINGDGRVDAEDIKLHIERDLFGYMYEFLRRAIPLGRGNSRTWQLGAMIEMAVTFRHDKLLQDALDSPFGLRQVFTNCFYRDGRFYEDSTGYSTGVNAAYLRIGGLLRQFRGRDVYPNGLSGEDVFGREYDNIHTFARRAASAGRLPFWGDGGNPRTPILKPRPKPQRSELFGDIGYAILRSRCASKQQLHLLLNFAQSGAGHGHRDQLMLKPIRWGYDFSADLGYPHNLRSPKRNEWCANSVTHGTVMVDNMEQRTGCAGSLDLYADTPWVKLVAASANDAYESVQLYHRTAAIVSMSDDAHYIVDIFRVKGGARRNYIYHSLSGDDGRNFTLHLRGDATPQPRPGTLAGPDVAWMANTGKTYHDSVDRQPGRRNGYSYLKDISVASAENDWRCEWRTGDAQDTGLMLWMAGAPGRKLYLGRGEGKGAPNLSPWDAYIVARDDSTPSNDESVFCCVFEPFQGQPRVREVARLPLLSDAVGSPVAIKVTTPEGRFVVFSAMASDEVHRFRDRESALSFQGRFEVRRWLNKATQAATVSVDPGDMPAFAGVVEALDFATPAARVAASAPLPTGAALAGQPIIFNHPDWPKTAVFAIKRIESCAKPGEYVVALDAPRLEIATGAVDQVHADRGSIFTKDSLEKLFNCHYLFDGKALYTSDRRHWFAIDQARAGYYGVGDVTIRFKDRAAAGSFKVGDRFWIVDVQPGAAFRINRVVTRPAAVE